MKPLCVDLFCGLGGWAEGFLAEGFKVVGFDIERHRYWLPETEHEGDGGKGTKPVEKRGWTQGCPITLGIEGATKKPRNRLAEYPGDLVLQDVLTLHGAQFKDAAVIVASPPCQEYSYMAMPWQRAKQIAAALRGHGEFPEGYTGSRTIEQLNALFNACFRIQREASEAAGRYIPLVVENVKGAHPWVGRAAWHYGSYYLWGDVPALMPFTGHSRMKCKVDCSPRRFDERVAKTPEQAHAMHFRLPKEEKPGRNFQSATVSQLLDGTSKRANAGLTSTTYGGDFGWDGSAMRSGNSHPPARKAASAQIAKIPFALAQWVARVYKPASVAIA